MKQKKQSYGFLESKEFLNISQERKLKALRGLIEKFKDEAGLSGFLQLEKEAERLESLIKAKQTKISVIKK